MEAGGGEQLAGRDVDARARPAGHAHGASSGQPSDQVGQAANPAVPARSHTAPPHAPTQPWEQGAHRREAEPLACALTRAAGADARADSGRPGGGATAPGVRAAAPAAAGAGGRSWAAHEPAAGAGAAADAAGSAMARAPGAAAACQPDAHGSGNFTQKRAAAGAGVELGVGQSVARTPPSPAARPRHPPPTCPGETASSHAGAPLPWLSASNDPPVAQHALGAEGGAGVQAAQRAGSPAARAATTAAEPAEASSIVGGGRPALAPGGTLAARPANAALQAAGLPGFCGTGNTSTPRLAGAAPGVQPGGPDTRPPSAGPAGTPRWGAALAAALVAAVAGAAAALPALAAAGRSFGRRASRGMPPGPGLEPAHAAGAQPPLASASAPAGAFGARRAPGLAPATASEAARTEATPRRRTLRMSTATGAET